MTNDDPESLGEIARNLRRFETAVTRSIENISQNFLLSTVWAVEKKALEDKLHSQGREIAQLRADDQTREAQKDLEHKELHNRIDLQRDALHRREDDIRKERAARWFAIGLAALGLVFGIISAVVATQISNGLPGAGG